MRYLFILSFICLLMAGCKKDKFTTAPQISYKSINPNVVDISLSNQVMPVLTIKVTDAEGDLGLIGKDTSKIFIKNLLTGNVDSTLTLPDLSGATLKNFQGEIEITLDTRLLLEGSARPRPKTDTLYYEVYIKDFAKNKSNVIKTTDPVYLIFR